MSKPVAWTILVTIVGGTFLGAILSDPEGWRHGIVSLGLFIGIVLVFFAVLFLGIWAALVVTGEDRK
jgi:hypothetical protein